MPVIFDCMVSNTGFVPESARSQVKPKVLRWDKGNIADYYQLTGELFFKIVHRLLCSVDKAMSYCNVIDYIDVDVYYKEIVKLLQTCAFLVYQFGPQAYWSEA